MGEITEKTVDIDSILNNDSMFVLKGGKAVNTTVNEYGAFHLAFRAQGTDDSRDTLKEPWGVVSEWPMARESRVHQAFRGEV